MSHEIKNIVVFLKTSVRICIIIKSWY